MIEILFNFLYWLRDVVTATLFISIMLACMLHGMKDKFWFLLPAKKKPVVRKKFQGSAATFVQ